MDLQQIVYLSNVLQIIQIIVTVFLSIFVFVLNRELHEAINARYLDGMKYVRDVIGTEVAGEKRKWVYRELIKATKPISREYDDKARGVCRDYDHIGLLCRLELLPTRFIIETYNRNIVEMWERLEPFIREWRQTLPDDDYFAEFEWLARKAKPVQKKFAEKRR